MSAYLLNPWAFVQFAHNQLAAVVTGSFVVAAIGAFYALRGVHPVQARLYLRAGTFVGLIASLLVAFPTGDHKPRWLAIINRSRSPRWRENLKAATMAGVASHWPTERC